jgi:hypothetical protein
MSTSPKTPAGDAIRVQTTERFDLADIGAQQSLVYEHIVAAFGALVGPAAGVLSNPAFNTSNLAAVVVGECLFYDGRSAGGGKLASGVLIPYDPTESWQSANTAVDLSSYLAGSGTPYLWAKRVQVESNAATRRQWDAGAEASFSPNTRYRERMEFAVGSTAPSSDYFKFAQVRSWTTGVPTILPIHAFDLTTEAVSSIGERLTAQLAGQTHVGIARVVTTILRTLRLHYDKDAAADSTWFTTPLRGLKQLDTDLAAVESLAGANEVRIFDPCTLFAGKVTHNITAETASISGQAFGSLAGASAPAVTYTDANNVEVVWSANSDYWEEIYAIHVTPAVASINTPAFVIAFDAGAHTFTVNTDGSSSDRSFYLTIIGRFVEAA